MGLIFVPYYIHFLGIEAYGLIGIFALLQAWLSLLDMGMTPTLSREMARFTAGAHDTQSIQNLLRTIEIITYSLAIVIGGCIWLSSDFLASNWLKAENLPKSVVVNSISIMAFVIALRFCETIYRGSLLGLEKQVWYNTVNALLSTLRGAGVLIILKWVSPTINAFFIWQGVISIISIVVLAFSVHSVLPKAPRRPRFSRNSLSSIWKFASGMLGISLLAMLLTQVDKALLSNLLPLKDFGYYTLATTVAGMMGMIVGPITMAIYPRMVVLATNQDNESLIHTYHNGAQLVTVLTAPMMLLLLFYSDGAIFAWSGNFELAIKSGQFLSILIIGNFLNGLMYMPYQCQLAHGWTSLTLKVNVVAVLVLVPAIFFCVPHFGAISAAWIWAALNAGYALFAIQLMHMRLLKSEKLKWYFYDLFLPTLGAFSVVAISRLFLPLPASGRLHWFIFLTITGSITVLATTLSANLIRPRFLHSFSVIFRTFTR